MAWEKFRYEREVVGALASCSMTPSSFDKKFVRDINSLFASSPDAQLTTKQVLCIWRIAKKYRRQLSNRKNGRTVKTNFVPLVDAKWNSLHEGIGIGGDWGRFEHQLSLEPDDWTTRSIFADFLEDQGESALAVGQRWQAANKKHPILVEVSCYQLFDSVVNRDYRHRWCLLDTNQSSEDDQHRPDQLDPNVFTITLGAYCGGRIMAERLLAARLTELETGEREVWQ